MILEMIRVLLLARVKQFILQVYGYPTHIIQVKLLHLRVVVSLPPLTLFRRAP